MGSSCSRSSNNLDQFENPTPNDTCCIVSMFHENPGGHLHDIVLEYKNDRYVLIQIDKTQKDPKIQKEQKEQKEQSDSDKVVEKMNSLFGAFYKLYETPKFVNSPNIYVISTCDVYQKSNQMIHSTPTYVQGDLIRINIKKIIETNVNKFPNNYVIMEDDRHRIIKISKFAILAIQMRGISLSNNFNEYYQKSNPRTGRITGSNSSVSWH